MKYKINMVSELRAKERRDYLNEIKLSAVVFVTMGMLFMSMFYSGIQVLRMQGELFQAQRKLKLLEMEYERYQATNMSINKEDLMLLDSLQRTRFFWTKKLSAMAQPLPENYWVNAIEFKNDKLRVDGFGYIDDKQKQLITLDDYLNIIRFDSNFSTGLPVVSLVETRRDDEEEGEKRKQTRERVSFDFSAKDGIVRFVPPAVKQRK